MNRKITAALAALASLSACQKKDDTAPDAGKAVMSIASPQAGQTFHSGDTVAIKASVSYPGELHGYEVKLVDTASGFVVYDVAQHIHDDHFVIDDHWAAGTATKPLVLRLSVIASIDHNGEDARKEIVFTVMP